MSDPNEISKAEATVAPSTLARARTALLELMQQHYRLRGVGPDAYRETAMVHPMAEGRFLSAASACLRAGLISPVTFAAYARTSIARLERRARPFGGGIGWGLDFAWKDAGAQEPYLITSAIVAQGLLDAAAVQPDLPHLVRCIEGVRSGLAGWWQSSRHLHEGLGVELPAFSPVMAKPVVNAAAYAAAILIAVVPERAAEPKARLLDIRRAYLPGIGWEYAPERPVVDLLHQCYILSALTLGLAGEESDPSFEARAIVETLAVFEVVQGQYLDAGYRLDDLKSYPPSGKKVLRFTPSGVVELTRNRARLWSLGELLAVMAARDLALTDSSQKLLWVRYATPVTEAVLARLAERNGEAHYPRHLMHAAYGLARLLEAARSARITAV